MNGRRITKQIQITFPGSALVTIVIILLGAWFLRIHHLDISSFWLDEIRSYGRALLPNWAVGRQALISANHAPLYEWVILRTWLQVGESEFLARFPGIVLSMLTLSVTYALGLALFRSRTVAVWATLFLATSALYLTFTRWVRPYALLSLLLTLTIFALWRALLTGRLRYWLFYGVTAAGAVYTHYFAAFTLFAVSILVLVRVVVERDKRLLRDWALANVLGALLFLPWLPAFRTELTDGAVNWIEPLTLTKIWLLLASLFGREVFSSTVTFALAISLWILIALGLIAWFRGLNAWPDRWSYPYIGLAASAGTILLVILVSIAKPLLVARYFQGALPAICVLLAFSVVYSRPRYLAIGLGLVVLVVGLLSSFQVADRQTTEDWKAVAAYIEANSRAEDKIAIIDERDEWLAPFQFYYGDDQAFGFVPGELNDSQVVRQAVAANCPCDRLWLAHSVRRSTTESLDYEPEDNYDGYHVVDRVTFADRLLKDRLAIDLWLLEKGPE